MTSGSVSRATHETWTPRRAEAAGGPLDAGYFGGLGGFGGLSGPGFEPLCFSLFGAGGAGGDSTAGAGGSTAGGAGAGVRGEGAGFGFGAAFLVGVDGAGFVDFAVVAFVAFGVGEGSAGVASGSTGVNGNTASSRGTRVVVGRTTVVSVTATGSGSRPTSATKPLSGVDGAGPGGVASNPRTPPIAKPTKMPTMDWIDLESIGPRA